MSIRIDKITQGRFGNKILQYNSLVQIANNLGVEPSCVEWDGHRFFKNLLGYKSNNKTITKLNWNDVLNKTDDELREITNTNCLNIDDPSYLLHNVFFKITRNDPRDFLKLKDEFIPELPANFMHIGIHIRGGDIRGSDGNHRREIHPTSYYINAIQDIENDKELSGNKIYYVCTDDKTFETYLELVKYLIQNNIPSKLGPNTFINQNLQHANNNYIFDFALLTECDIIISSSSTFAIAATFIGKQNKKLIFYKSWLERNINHEKWGNYTKDYPREYWLSYDNFWIDISNGGKTYINVWKIIE